MNPQLIIDFIRDKYSTYDFIPLHAPKFGSNEKKFVADTIESTFVSSVGKYVDELETRISNYTKSPRSVATVNGTAALHTALYMAGVERGDLVITQALTFVATCNAIYHMGAEPIFVDVSPVSLGLCPKALEEFLNINAHRTDSGCVLKANGRIIKAVVPMHTFGHPVELDELIKVCNKWAIVIIEDAAESLGSFYKNKHTGTLGLFGALSFNGNKIITTGGGGMVLCSTNELGEQTKYLTTTAKKPHQYEFYHDKAGFNYRLPNINAALGCAQMESIEEKVIRKRKLADDYNEFFKNTNVSFFVEPYYAKSNYWLNAIICKDQKQRDEILKTTNNSGVMTRPIWNLMNRLPMYKDCIKGPLKYSEYLESRLVNLPSHPTS